MRKNIWIYQIFVHIFASEIKYTMKRTITNKLKLKMRRTGLNSKIAQMLQIDLFDQDFGMPAINLTRVRWLG